MCAYFITFTYVNVKAERQAPGAERRPERRSPEVEPVYWNLTNLKHADEGPQHHEDNAIKISKFDSLVQKI